MSNTETENIFSDLVGDDDSSTQEADLLDESSEDTSPTPGAASQSEQEGSPLQTFEKVLIDSPQPLFQNKDYYRIILHDEGELARQMHVLLGNFLRSENADNRDIHRERLVPAYWDFMSSVALKIARKLPAPKILLLRFGILLPTMLSVQQRELISRIPYNSKTKESVYYCDEWLRAIALGQVNLSFTDEDMSKMTRRPQKGQRINHLLDKHQGRFDALLQLVRKNGNEMRQEEDLMKERTELLLRHQPVSEHDNIPAPYTENQKESLEELNAIVSSLIKLNNQLVTNMAELKQLQQQLDKLKESDSNAPSGWGSFKTIEEELKTIRKMVKVCVGRKGNHFPMLVKQYFMASLQGIGSRENVINMMSMVENVDPGVFVRVFKQQANRIFPNVILVPCYGEIGVCWEPFERHSRVTSRGKIIIPIFSRDIKVAVAAALGDLRWQVAKEKAQHYWMDEGLTGQYYQYFSDKKRKGNIKEEFVKDYILWVTKEAEGTQRLDKEVRSIFWRKIPFPQSLRDQLKNRGFVYNELYKKDKTRALSDGY